MQRDSVVRKPAGQNAALAVGDLHDVAEHRRARTAAPRISARVSTDRIGNPVSIDMDCAAATVRDSVAGIPDGREFVGGLLSRHPRIWGAKRRESRSDGRHHVYLSVLRGAAGVGYSRVRQRGGQLAFVRRPSVAVADRRRAPPPHGPASTAAGSPRLPAANRLALDATPFPARRVS